MMILWRIALGLLCVCSCAFGRTVTKWNDGTSVNLVEFTIRGVVYGKCFYRNPHGEEISVIFEDREDGLKAKSLNPTVIDPVSSTNECREAATKPPLPNLTGRSDLENTNTEDFEWNLLEQFSQYEEQTRSNFAYVTQLRPRFIGKLKKILALGLGLGALNNLAGTGTMNHVSAPQPQKPIGLSFSGSAQPQTNKFFPAVHLMQPPKGNSHVIHGVPDKFGQQQDIPGIGSLLGGMFF